MFQQDQTVISKKSFPFTSHTVSGSPFMYLLLYSGQVHFCGRSRFLCGDPRRLVALEYRCCSIMSAIYSQSLCWVQKWIYSSFGFILTQSTHCSPCNHATLSDSYVYVLWLALNHFGAVLASRRVQCVVFLFEFGVVCGIYNSASERCSSLLGFCSPVFGYRIFRFCLFFRRKILNWTIYSSIYINMFRNLGVVFFLRKLNSFGLVPLCSIFLFWLFPSFPVWVMNA